MSTRIIVGRDRAHVRTLLDEYPHCEVTSASAFFDKIRTVAFLGFNNLKLDEHAPLIFASQILAQNPVFPLSYAPHFAQAYAAFYHGTLSPREIISRLGDQEYNFSLALNICALIQDKMHEHNLATKVSSLYSAWRLCEEKKIIPPALVKTSHICLRYLIDLTALETEVLKTLARLGLKIDLCFPLDFAKRKLNVALDFAARQFENGVDNNNLELSFDTLAKSEALEALINALFVDDAYLSLEQEHCELYEAANLLEEARHIATRIATRKIKAPGQSIALVMRSYDQRAVLFKRALLAHNINVKDRKGQPLLETPAGILLQDILQARLQCLPKSILLNLVNNSLLSFKLSDNLTRAMLFELLENLGIDDRFIALDSDLCRYEKALEQWQKKLDPADQDAQEQARASCKVISEVKTMLNNIKISDNFAGFLNSIYFIINNYFNADNNSTQELLLFVNNLLKSLAHNNNLTNLRDLISLFMAPLQKITVARPDHSDQNAVEFLLLPELLGRHFDHIFIADLSFGRMPKSPHMDPLLSDEQRLALNKALGFQALRVFFDDPFEPLPVPPRQALEPFWFAAAISAAQKSIYFSYAMHDHTGSDQAASEFFIWLKEHVKIHNNNSSNYNFISNAHQRFLLGKQENLYNKKSDNIYIKALNARRQAFSAQESHALAFAFDQKQLVERFEGRLGAQPWRALSPTMIEAFASCAFHGLLARLINIRIPKEDHDDLDARVLGHIAHQTLENFFAQKNNLSLKNILQEVGENYINKNYVAHPDIFWCYVDWLYESLNKLAQEFAHKPLAQEQAFGLQKHSLPALALKTKNNNFLVGGIIDRVDLLDNHIHVTDYKLSSISTLRLMGSASAMLKTNFQVPIYLRLAAQAWADHDFQRVSFIFASIRDAALLPALSAARHLELFQKIFDDSHPEGLAQSLDNIFMPIMKGQALAQKSAQCIMCDFSYICRYEEASAS